MAASASPPSREHFTVKEDTRGVYLVDDKGNELVAEEGYKTKAQYLELAKLLNEIVQKREDDKEDGAALFKFDHIFKKVQIDFDQTPGAPKAVVTRMHHAAAVAGVVPTPTLVPAAPVHVAISSTLAQSFQAIHAAAMAAFSAAKAAQDGDRKRSGAPDSAVPKEAEAKGTREPEQKLSEEKAAEEKKAKAAASPPAITDSHSFRSLHDIASAHSGGRLPDRFEPPELMRAALRPSHQGKVYRSSDGTPIAREELHRLPAIEENLQIARGHVERIKANLGQWARIEKPTPDASRFIAGMKEELAHYEKVVANSERYMKEYGAMVTEPGFVDVEGFVKRDWASPNYSRDLLLDHGFERGVGMLVPALVNLRVHTIAPVITFEPELKRAEEGEVKRADSADRFGVKKMEALEEARRGVVHKKLTRVAVLTDDSCGWISLKELNELRALRVGYEEIEPGPGEAEKQAAVLAQYDEAICKKASVIIKKVRTARSSLPKKITKPEHIKDAIKGLEGKIANYKELLKDPSISGKKNFEIRAKINRLESAKHALSQLESIKYSPGGLDQLIAQRERVLKDKALLLLQVQIREHPDKLKDGQFKMGFVGLVNQETAQLDKSGIMRNERVMMEDNAAIFGILNGMNIKFTADAESPNIDGNDILFPLANKPEGAAVENEFMLRAVYVNVCAQPSFFGHTRNEGAQLALNEEAAKAVNKVDRDADGRVLDPGPIEPLVRQLEEYNTLRPGRLGGRVGVKGGYGKAEDITQAFIDAGYATITGCASAKDRTLVNTSNVLHRGDRTLAHRPRGEEAQRRRDAMLAPDSPNIHVIEEGTGIRSPKINTFDAFDWTHKNFWWGIALFFKFKFTTNVHEKRWKEKVCRIIESVGRDRVAPPGRSVGADHRITPLSAPPAAAAAPAAT